MLKLLSGEIRKAYKKYQVDGFKPLLKTGVKYSLDLGKESVANQLLSYAWENQSGVFYVVDGSNWSINWDGKNVTDQLQSKGYHARTTTRPFGISNQIIHFGYEALFEDVDIRSLKELSEKNYIVVTWFHISAKEDMNNFIIENSHLIDKIHTSCNLTKEGIINMGISRSKVEVIPIGVDLNTFYPYKKDTKEKIRKDLNISDDTFVIGSFQKDGEGWDKGLEPKYRKGPDVLVDVLGRISNHTKIKALLTGPARGYVKQELEKRGVPYHHEIVDEYTQMSDYYNAIDSYLVTSRVEGGPKGIIESMACGVPLVTTKVGMAPDILEHNKNALLAEVNDNNSLSEITQMLIENKDKREFLSKNAKKDIKSYSWNSITEKYSNKLYI